MSGSLTGVKAKPARREIIRVWAGLLGPPVIWLIALSVNYALAHRVCEGGPAWPMHVVTGAALLLVAGTTWISWQSWKELGVHDAGETVLGRRRLMAIGGLTNGAFFALAILGTAIPHLVLHGC